MITALDNVFVYLTILLGLVFVWFISYWRRQKHFHLEYGKRNVPYINILSVNRSMLLRRRQDVQVYRTVREGNPIFGFNRGDDSITIVVAVPEIIQQVLSKEFDNFTNRREFPYKDKLLSEMLFFSENDQWRRLRAIVEPIFSMGKIQKMKPLIDETTRTLIKNLDLRIMKNQLIDVKKYSGSFTMDSIIRTAFGIEIDSISDPDNPLVNNAQEIFSSEFGIFSILLMIAVTYVPQLSNLVHLKYDPILFFRNSTKSLIKRKRIEFANNIRKIDDQRKGYDFIELILEAEMNGEITLNSLDMIEPTEDKKMIKCKYISEDEMVAQCVLFFTAGYDTTATTVMMALYNLTIYPEHQEKVYEEIESIMANLAMENPYETDPFQLVDANSLDRFKYLDGVIKETLRLYAPIPSIERRTHTQMRLESHDGKVAIDVKPGDIIHIPIHALHHDPEQFPDPYDFRPERFFLESKTHHKYSFLPFGSGPRHCAAKNLAILEAKSAIMHIIRRYKLLTCNQTPIRPKFYNQDEMLAPEKILIKFEKRQLYV